jgi:hypothetical protein
MGKRNRERRRQKARQRGARPAGDRGRAAGPGWRQPRLDGELIVAAIDTAAALFADGDMARYAELVDLLVVGPPGPGGDAAVDLALAGSLERAVTGAWRGGWQPADLIRAARREATAVHVAVMAAAVTAEARRYAAVTIDPRWATQLDAVAAEQRSSAAQGERADVIGRSLEVLALLLTIPTLPQLLPLPGQATSGGRRRTGIDGRLLERVRALLAKAESTTFAGEADALTAKAQELMARHSIDQAMLDAGRGIAAVTEGRRIGVDDPYAGPKALLLSQVAGANRCRAVWLSGIGSSDVFGEAADLDAVELLFTSLLRQATTAMLAEGPGRRTRSFRQSFLVAFADRIGERLREQDAATTAAAADVHGPGVLPVLASRATAADEAAAAAFPSQSRRVHSANDAAGWAAGRVAADLADLGVRAEVEGAAG